MGFNIGAPFEALGGLPGSVIGGLAGGIGAGIGSRADRAEELYGGVDPSGAMGRAADQSATFGAVGAKQYGALGQEANQERGHLRDLARGENSISAEQLRQGLAQNISGQQAMAASARPGMAPMAARTASMQAARMGSGMAGQQAVAGLAERQQAQQALQQALMQQRQQDMQAALGGQQNALSGYGQIEGARTNRYGALMGAPTAGEAGLSALTGAAALAGAKSDRRAKRDIRSGDTSAERLLKGLKAYRFRYRDKKDGDGDHLGIMAQDLERAGLKQAVIDTPSGKFVHGAKLATALAATLPGLNRRLERLEKR